MNLQKAKEKYPVVKSLYEAAVDADRKDELAQLARSSLTVSQMETMKSFLRQCEDFGVPQVIRSVN